MHRPTSYLFFLFILVSILACVQPKAAPNSLDCPLEKTPTCEIILTYALDERFTAGQGTSIQAAMTSWNTGTKGRVCFWPDRNLPDLLIIKAATQEDLRLVDPKWESHIGLYMGTVVGGFIWIVTSIDGEQNSPQLNQAIAVHELGHALKLNHTKLDVPSVLHPAVDADARSGHIFPADYLQLCQYHSCRCER